ncbi:UTRA domain-containing protein [Kitasatospora sp. NPDC086791]|uniref:UTRA domain-containing protein n=1 Tax=Kitasatospora sp. NPDC086791 TaxID=3155178 RepID=UPI0034346BD5
MTAEGEELDASEAYLKPPKAGSADPWTTQAKTAGGVPGQRLISAGVVPAPARVASALGLTAGQPVVSRTRLVLLNDRAVEVVVSYFPVEIAGATALAERRRIRGGHVALLADLGFRTASAPEEVRARPISSEELEILDASAEDWVFDVFRTVFDQAGTAFEVTQMTMLARERTLHYTVQIG